ncbi:MAG: OFA family MFS transporter [Ruminococcaceae bacterium]|nr:OFA family MFS transporter [Oscillospiraceae bacterium]
MDRTVSNGRLKSGAIPQRRWLYLGVGTIMLLLLGLIYAWSVFIAPLEVAFGWNRAETSMTFTISIVMFCVGGIIAGIIAKKVSSKIILTASAVLLFAGFFLASRIASLAGIYVAYGVFVGLGVGLAYNALINIVTKWFPDKKGLASGILLMGFGVGGMVLGTLATSLMASLGWRTVFIGFAIVFAAVVLVGALVLRQPRPDELELFAKVMPATAATQAPDVTPGQMMHTKSFWLYFLWCLGLCAAGLIIIGHSAAAALDAGADIGSAALIAGLVSVFNGLGRVLFGLMYDRAGFKRTLMLVNISALIAPVMLILSAVTGQMFLLIIGFVFTGLFYGGLPTMNTTYVSNQYGQKNFAVNLSITNCTMLLAPFVGTYLAGGLRTSTGSYMWAFIIMLAFSVLAVFSSTILQRRAKTPIK